MNCPECGYRTVRKFAIAKAFDNEVKHEKVISFKHGNNVIENFWRCKNRFPRMGLLDTTELQDAKI